MLSITLTESGKPDVFTNLYPLEINNFSSFLSTNIINGLVLVGLLTQAILISVSTGSITLGLASGLITFTVAFPMAQQVLPFFIREFDDLMRFISAGRFKFPGNWHKYFAGLLFAMFLLGVQYILIVGFTKYIITSGIEII